VSVNLNYITLISYIGLSCDDLQKRYRDIENVVHQHPDLDRDTLDYTIRYM